MHGDERDHQTKEGTIMTEPTAYTPEEIARHRRQWITALRSKLPQAYGRLRDRSGQRDGFCCLGVAEKARGARWKTTTAITTMNEWATEDEPENYSLLSRAACAWYGILVRATDPYVVWSCERDSTPLVLVRTLTGLNDDERLSLTEIADVIEDQGDDWDGSHDWAIAEHDRRRSSRP
jgi:hypothetical protein